MAQQQDELRQIITVDFDDSGIARANAAEKQLQQSTEQAGRAADEASRKSQTREQRLRELGRRLVQLQRLELQQEADLKRGIITEDQATNASRRRALQTERIARVLNTEAEAQRRANAAIEQSTTRMFSASGVATSFTRVISGAAASIGGLVAGIVGVGGLLKALDSMGRGLDDRTQQTREFSEALLNLQYLSESFNQREKDFVFSASKISGRSPVETVRAYTDQKSAFPELSDVENQKLFLETAEFAATTDAPLADIQRAMSAVFRETGDAQQAQNIVAETIVQAGKGDPAVLATGLSRYMSTGVQTAGLTPGQSAGAVAAAMGLDSDDPAVQVQALRTLTERIRGDVNPETAALLQRENIDTSDFLGAIDQIAVAVNEGRISQAEFSALTGLEASKFKAILNDRTRAAFLQKIRAVDAASTSKRDITADKIDAHFRDDAIGRTNFAIKQTEAAIAVAKSEDLVALEKELVLRQAELHSRLRGESDVDRDIRLYIAKKTAAFNTTAEQTAFAAGGAVSPQAKDALRRVREGDLLFEADSIEDAAAVAPNTAVQPTPSFWKQATQIPRVVKLLDSTWPETADYNEVMDIPMVQDAINSGLPVVVIDNRTTIGTQYNASQDGHTVHTAPSPSRGGRP